MLNGALDVAPKFPLAPRVATTTQTPADVGVITLVVESTVQGPEVVAYVIAPVPVPPTANNVMGLLYVVEAPLINVMADCTPRFTKRPPDVAPW